MYCIRQNTKFSQDILQKFCANIVDPDQTAHRSGLIIGYTVCANITYKALSPGKRNDFSPSKFEEFIQSPKWLVFTKIYHEHGIKCLNEFGDLIRKL